MSFYKKYQEAWDDQDIGDSTMSGIGFVLDFCQIKSAMQFILDRKRGDRRRHGSVHTPATSLRVGIAKRL